MHLDLSVQLKENVSEDYPVLQCALLSLLGFCWRRVVRESCWLLHRAAQTAALRHGLQKDIQHTHSMQCAIHLEAVESLSDHCSSLHSC
jgi:hypothetical protein